MTEVSRTFAAKNEEKINTMLHEETIHNRTEPWNKLDKTTKLKLLCVFVDNILTTQHCLTLSEINDAKQMLHQCLNEKKLQYVKEVQYDKINCVVTGIPALKINPSLRQFQLDRLTPQVSMLTSLGKGRGSILQEK